VPRRALSSLLRIKAIRVLRGIPGFSAPKGIVFIATRQTWNTEMGAMGFQCPEGHCLHCYKPPTVTRDREGKVSVPRRALSSLLQAVEDGVADAVRW